MHVNILKAGLVVSKETLNLDLRISHTNYSVILGHLSLFLCFKICEHPQGTNATVGYDKKYCLAVFSDSSVLYIFIWDVFSSTSVKDFPVSFSPLYQLICIFKDPDSFSPWVSHSPQLCNFYI